jgi:hypothetical protein
MTPTDRGRRIGPLDVLVDEEIESSMYITKALAPAPASGVGFALGLPITVGKH